MEKFSVHLGTGVSFPCHSQLGVFQGGRAFLFIFGHATIRRKYFVLQQLLYSVFLPTFPRANIWHKKCGSQAWLSSQHVSPRPRPTPQSTVYGLTELIRGMAEMATYVFKSYSIGGQLNNSRKRFVHRLPTTLLKISSQVQWPATSTIVVCNLA